MPHRLPHAVLTGLGVALLLAPPARAVSPPTATQTWVARLSTRAAVRATPDGKLLYRQPAAGEFGGGPVRLTVTDVARTADGEEWLKVLLPRRPNGYEGWIRRDIAHVAATPWKVDVDLGDRTVTVLKAGKAVKRISAVVGAPGTPTPTGLGSVYEVIKQADPKGFIGPWVLHLTLHSTVYENFGGGDGRVGIHGRGPAALGDPLGTARSHGCVRISSAVVTWMAAHLRTGTPVEIHG